MFLGMHLVSIVYACIWAMHTDLVTCPYLKAEYDAVMAMRRK